MAATGYTPIKLYASTTALAVPLAANLDNTNGAELAINITDGKLYYKNNSNVVTLLAAASGASGDVVGPASSTANGVALFDGTTGKLLQSPSTITYASSTLSLPTISPSANLAFTGTGNRITGDFSNATTSSRAAFQSSTTNGNTLINAIPNGTSQISGFYVYNNSDSDNSSTGLFLATSTAINLNANKTGTGTYLPLTFSTGGAERMRLDTSGNLGIGTNSPSTSLTIVDNATAANTKITISRTGLGTTATYSSTELGTTTNSPIDIITNNSTRVRVDSSGNVGIGTTSPAATLDVLGPSAVVGTGYLSKAIQFAPSNFSTRTWSFSYDDSGAVGNGFSISAASTKIFYLNANGNAAVGTTSPTAMLQTAGSSSVAAFKTPNILEVATVSATAATGTINYDCTTQSVLYYTTNASGNFTINFRASSGTTLNTIMATGESMSFTFLNTNGSTAYYNSSVQVDGTTSGVTTKWQGGTAPTSGNASSIDSYTYVVIKTGSATFTVLAAQTKFA